MSDYMFMLESHLTPAQAAVMSEVQAAAASANLSLFLTGGAMRDMLGGFPIRDLDFTVEGNPQKIVKALVQKAKAQVLYRDDNRRLAELRFPGGGTAEISMSRQERYPRPAGKPQVSPATIHEDLRGRDFSVNAVALSLNRASRGLLIDPNNGQADLERRELRAISNTGFYDDPVRLLRVLRLGVRYGFVMEPRTKQQYDNAREAEMEKKIPAEALSRELRHIADEPSPAEVLRTLDQENMMVLFSPALTGAKLNLQGFQKLARARQHLPFGVDLRLDNLGIFLWVLTEKLSAHEEAAFARQSALPRSAMQLARKLEAHAKPLEKALKPPKLSKPSQVYSVLAAAPGDQILFVLLNSDVRLVHDRIKNYLQKYVLTAMEVTDDAVAAAGYTPGTPKFARAKQDMISARLDARPKKQPPPEMPAPAAAAMAKK